MSKSANGSGCIRKRSNGTWEGRYTVGIDFSTGKQIQKSVYAKTQQECRKKLAECVRAVDHHQYTEGDKQLLKSWLDQWYTNYCTVNLSPYSLRCYRNAIDNHISPVLGRIPLGELTVDHVQELVRILNEGSSTNKPLSPKTIRNTLGVLSKALNQAVLSKKISSNPAAFKYLNLPKADKTKGRERALTIEQQRAYSEIASESEFYVPLMFCMILGLREGECLGLSWNNVDFDNGTITICQQLQKRTGPEGKGTEYYIRNKTKSGVNRTLHLPAMLIDMLKETRQKQIENRLKAGALWNNEWNLCFTNPIGENIKFRTLVKVHKRICKAAGIPEDCRVHDLRHTAATTALINGGSIKAVQNLLGHSDAQITLNIYVDNSKEMEEQLTKSQEAFMENVIALSKGNNQKRA